MTNLLAKLFSHRAEDPAPSRGDMAYAAVMNESDDLLDKMRGASGSTDAARAVMADIWHQNRNVPFMTTIVQSVQEMKSGIEQKSGDE